MPYFVKILVAPNERLVGVKVPISDGKNFIGRVNPPCSIQLDSAKVSKRHCVIVQTGPDLVMEDLNSSNGVYVNGSKISDRQSIKVGDRFVIGEFTLEVTAG